MVSYEMLAFRYIYALACRFRKDIRIKEHTVRRFGRPDGTRQVEFAAAFAPHKLEIRNGELVQVSPGANSRTDFYVVARLQFERMALVHVYHTTNYDDGTYSTAARSTSSRLLIRLMRTGDPVMDAELFRPSSRMWETCRRAWRARAQERIHWCSQERRAELWRFRHG